MNPSNEQQNLKDIADTMAFPTAPTVYPVTADPKADAHLPDDYTKNTYQFTVLAVSANSEGKDFFCFNIAALVYVRPPQMVKKPFTGGLDAPAEAGISTFQPPARRHSSLRTGLSPESHGMLTGT